MITRTKESIKKAKRLITDDINFLLKIKKISDNEIKKIKKKIEFSYSIENSVKIIKYDRYYLILLVYFIYINSLILFIILKIKKLS